MASHQRQRSASFSGTPTSRPVTALMAQNNGTAQKTQTITASDVRGFTQATPRQWPTVYLNNGGRVTQEHNKPKNVGGHSPHPVEHHFDNVPTRLVRQARAEGSGARGAVQLYNQQPVAHDNPHEPHRLVEIHGKNAHSVSSTHVSRSAFVSLAGPGNSDARARAIESLRAGPTNAQSLNRPVVGSRTQDDWAAHRAEKGRIRLY